jgi:hypothetical protein
LPHDPDQRTVITTISSGSHDKDTLFGHLGDDDGEGRLGESIIVTERARDNVGALLERHEERSYNDVAGSTIKTTKDLVRPERSARGNADSLRLGTADDARCQATVAVAINRVRAGV